MPLLGLVTDGLANVSFLANVLYAPFISYTMLVGAVTGVFGASVGLMQVDLKKVIAYSTCSQLGYMIFSCGLSAYSLTRIVLHWLIPSALA